MEFKSNQTIASQIADFVKREIFSGRYEPGQKVPPIREFAAFCCVNPNTVVKVYAQLEAERLIYTDSTLGKFVNPDRGGDRRGAGEVPHASDGGISGGIGALRRRQGRVHESGGRRVERKRERGEKMSERDGEGTEKKELFGCADVVKWFGRKLVLDGARFLVPYGGVAGIFGLNGSGKTTLLRILAGLDRDFEGELSKTDFEDVAYMATEGGFPFGMSVRDAVNFYAAFLPRLDADAIFRDAREAGIRS